MQPIRLAANPKKGAKVKPRTHGYEPGPRETWYQQPRDLPMFSFYIIRMMMMEPAIKLGLAMRASPICSAEFAYKEDGGKDWTPGILAENPEVGEFAHKQYKRIWNHQLDKLLPAQIWGWAACEVMFNRNAAGQIEVGEFLCRRARDVVPLVQDGERVGVRFSRIKGQGAGDHVDVFGPKAVWHAHAPEDDGHFGESVLRGSYSPWADKWLNGGALDVRRLFMHKDAYGGVDMTYPDGTTYIDGKGEVPNRDIAREIAEQLKAGGVTTRPAAYDQNGNELWTLTRASIPGNPSHILQYPKDLDVEILRGMEIPDDVLTSETSGAWQGKQVPQQAFYTGLNRWAARLVRDIKPAVQFAVDCTFGPGQTFEPELKPIDATMSEQEGSKDPSQQQPGQAGSGGLGQQQWHREPGPSPNQMSLDAAGHEHRGKGEGGGQFTRMEPNEAAAFIQKIRAGDSRSKNQGRESPEMVNEPMVISRVPISLFDRDIGNGETYFDYLESSTSKARVADYVRQKIKTPIVVHVNRKGVAVISDGGHRLMAARARGDKEIHAIIPERLHRKLHGTDPQHLAFDPTLAVGHGVLSAAELVQAARTAMGLRVSQPEENQADKFVPLAMAFLDSQHQSSRARLALDTEKPAMQQAPNVTLNMAAPSDKVFADNGTAIAEAIITGMAKMQPTQVNVAAPIVNVEPPQVNVNVEAPKAPIVNVKVPQQAAPVVNVAAPVVNIEPPEPAEFVETETIIKRNAEGEIIKAIKKRRE